MSRRLSQAFFCLAAAFSLGLAASLPFPPQSWEQSALVRLGLLAIASLSVAVLLSFIPKFGRLLALLVRAIATVQLLVILISLRRARSESPSSEVVLAVAPFACALLGGALVARRMPG